MAFVLVFANIFCCSILYAKMQINKRQRARGKAEKGRIAFIIKKMM
jgi:hypothetical protein